jgi:hypothetical protein
VIRHCPTPATVASTTSADWWIALLSGTVAALITAGTVYGVFLGTRRAERMKDRAGRTSASVAGVIEASNAINIATATTDEFRIQTFAGQSAFSNALQLFAAREIPDHPEVARWAITQARDFTDAAMKIVRVKGVDDDEFKKVITEADLPQMASRISAALLRWLRDGVDKPFDGDLPKSLSDV